MADNPFPHLPAGYEPGLQSRRNRKQRSLLAPFVGFVGTAMFMAGVWAAAGGRGPQFDRQEELLGGIIFALGGLLCVYGAFAMQAKGRPKRHARLRGTTVSVDRIDPRRGEEVAITVAARSDGAALELGLVCIARYDVEVRVRVRGATVVRRETGESRVREDWRPLASGLGEQTVALVVPDDAPYSYEGECVSFAWLASARAVRRLAKDARVEEPIWVRP